MGEQFGSQSASPLVEVAEDDSVSPEFLVLQDLVRDHRADLRAALQEIRAHMNIEYVQDLAASKLDIGPQTAAFLASPNADVIAARKSDGQPGKHDIAVNAATDTPDVPHCEVKP